jgi:hypothetical protein
VGQSYEQGERGGDVPLPTLLDGEEYLMSEPVAFTYQAAFHCVPCAKERWGDDVVEGNTYDLENNPVRAVYGFDDVRDDGESCGTCLAWAVEPVHHLAGECSEGGACRFLVMV